MVEGQFGAFDLTIDPDPIPVTGGNITSSISTACIDVALGPISGSFGTGTDISYQWFKQIEGQNAQSIVGATDRELTASQAGTMPADTNVNWVRFYRETLACGGNNQPSNTITINKQSSDINTQSITYQPTSQITTAGPYTIPPNLALTRNIGMFTGPVATGSPGPTTSTWEIITPTNSSWTTVATGTSWTPHLLAGGQPFSASGVYRVRRRVTNGCDRSAFSNEIIINVQDDLGSISGRVATPTGSPVDGASVKVTMINTVQGGEFAAGPTVMTNTDGAYTIPNLYFGADSETAQYRVEPSLTVNGTVHSFTPTERTVNVQSAPRDISNINFTDNTALSISGSVSQLLDNNINMVCGMDSVVISVNNIPVDTTASDGNYTISVNSPGNYNITASYKNHSFLLNYVTFNFGDDIPVTSDITGLDSRGVTTYTISGQLTDGCGSSIGEANLRFQDFNNCWSRDVQTVNGGFFSNVVLPGRRYKLTVTNHADALVNNFFSTVQNINLTEANIDSLALKYRAQPVSYTHLTLPTKRIV